MSGWETLVTSFGLSTSQPDPGHKSNKSNPQGTYEMRKSRPIAQERHEVRRPPPGLTLPGPSREVGVLYQWDGAVLIEQTLGGPDSTEKSHTRRGACQNVETSKPTETTGYASFCSNAPFSSSPPEQRARSNSHTLMNPSLYRAGSAPQSVPNIPRSGSFGSHGERVLGRGLRKQRSGMRNRSITTNGSVDTPQR